MNTTVFIIIEIALVIVLAVLAFTVYRGKKKAKASKAKLNYDTVVELKEALEFEVAIENTSDAQEEEIQKALISIYGLKSINKNAAALTVANVAAAAKYQSKVVGNKLKPML